MPGLVPGTHVLRAAGRGVDGRAFATPKRLRPRRRDKPGHDAAETSVLLDVVTNLRVRQPCIDLLPDQRQRFSNISITLQCGIMKVVPCRRGAFARD